MTCDDRPVALKAAIQKTLKHFGAFIACRIRNALLVSFYEKEHTRQDGLNRFPRKGSFDEQYPKLQWP